MNYIVMDLEWNQGFRGRDRENETIPFEIIEIGAVKLNSEFYETGTFSRLVKPQIYREMNQITSQLVHINMRQLYREKSFVEVMEDFLEWCGREEYIFVTWGTLDLTELQRNMRFYDMEPLFDGPAKFLDMQKIFSIAYEDSKIRRTLEWAIEYLGTEFDYTVDFVEKYKEDGIIWFLEACDLNVFSIRRAMWQMEKAGWFKYVKGFLFGRPANGDFVWTLDRYQAVLKVAAKYNVPVIMDMDIGHMSPMMPLVVGSMAKVDLDGNSVSITMEYK